MSAFVIGLFQMDPKALVKAGRRLRQALRSAQALSPSPNDFDAFAAEWFTFLVNCKGVYQTLSEGAKASPQSRQWFGRIRRIRQETPLYQYLFQARDDDVHGLEQNAEYVPTALIFEEDADDRPPPEGVGLEVVGRFLLIGTQGSGMIRVTGQTPYIRLLPVTGRGPIAFDPPLEHEGHVFGVNAPREMAQFMTDHLEAVLAEAERLEK
jgi:hypothetical protein